MSVGKFPTAPINSSMVLRADDLRELMKKLTDDSPSLMDTNPFPRTLLGMPIIVAEPLPAIKLRDHLPVSDEFRTKFNIWLLATFGTKSPIPKGTAYIMSMPFGVMRPENCVRLVNCT